jgi:hypothetical protein
MTGQSYEGSVPHEDWVTSLLAGKTYALTSKCGEMLKWNHGKRLFNWVTNICKYLLFCLIDGAED